MARGGLPHARGGVSPPHRLTRGILMSSPRTWGCFRYFDMRDKADLVFPTHVGVFLF